MHNRDPLIKASPIEHAHHMVAAIFFTEFFNDFANRLLEFAVERAYVALPIGSNAILTGRKWKMVNHILKVLSHNASCGTERAQLFVHGVQ